MGKEKVCNLKSNTMGRSCPKKGLLISLSPMAYSDGQGMMRDHLGERNVGSRNKTNQKVKNGTRGSFT